MEVLSLGEVEIEIHRRKVKNLRLTVYPPTGRVHLIVPEQVETEMARLFALNHFVWIKRNIRKFLEQERDSVKSYENRESHQVFGRRLLLKIKEANEWKVYTTKRELVVSTPQVQNKPRIEKEIKSWLNKNLKIHLSESLEFWSGRLEIQIPRYSMRAMKTKWASCNRKNYSILFNSELAKQSVDSIHYIALHELIHFEIPNHSEKFKNKLSGLMPNWTVIESELNKKIR